MDIQVGLSSLCLALVIACMVGVFGGMYLALTLGEDRVTKIVGILPFAFVSVFVFVYIFAFVLSLSLCVSFLLSLSYLCFVFVFVLTLLVL